RQFAEILGGCCEQEFVPRPIRPAQAQSIELKNALEMSEQHLNLLAHTTRCSALPRACNLTSHVTCAFVNRALHSTHRHRRTAPRVEDAVSAVTLAGAIKKCRAVVHQCSARGQHLARGTEVDISLVVVGEVVTRKGTVLAG